MTVNGDSQAFTFNDANEVTNAGWEYDVAGNLLNDGTTSATYDALGRTLSRSTGGVTTDYQYNGDGLLVQAGTTTYAQDLAAPLSQVLMLGDLTMYYGHERLAIEIPPVAREWQLHDGLGSVRQTLGREGGLTGTWRSDPWGSPVGASPDGFGFAGELQDAGGDVYLRARWYAPQHGVFTSRDPFPGWNAQPASQHPYAYALNNPVVYTDPSGWCVGAECKAGQDLPPDLACIARGGRWNYITQECDEGWPAPPPNNPEPAQQDDTPPNPTPTLDPLLLLMAGAGVIGRPQGGSQEEEALIKAGLCTAAALSALEALARGLEGVRDRVQPRQQPRKHISLGLNTDNSDGDFTPLLFVFTLNLNAKLNSHGVWVYAYGDWVSAGLSDTPTRYFEEAFTQAVQKAEHIHFNLEGIRGDPVKFAENLGSGPFQPWDITATELYRIRHNPALCSKTSFYLQGSTDVSAPSAEMKARICSIP